MSKNANTKNIVGKYLSYTCLKKVVVVTLGPLIVMYLLNLGFQALISEISHFDWSNYCGFIHPVACSE